MPKKVKYTLREIREADRNGELDGNETFYTRSIIAFIRQVTKEEIYKKLGIIEND